MLIPALSPIPSPQIFFFFLLHNELAYFYFDNIILPFSQVYL